MTLDIPEALPSFVRAQMTEWMRELERLGREPTVRKFRELRRKIDEADAFIAEADASSVVNRSAPFDPYDAFEFARDLTDREVSTLEVAKLAYGRFPDMSDETRQGMMHYLIDNGFAEVARKTPMGRPAWYRFGSPGNWGSGGVGGNRKRFGVPDSELSWLKREDLEEVVVPSSRASGRP